MRPSTEAEKRIVLDGVEEITLRQQIVDGLRGYCNAVHNLADAQRKLQAIYCMERENNILPRERVKDVLLGLTRTVNHMADGYEDIPADLWAILLADSTSQPREALTALLKKSA